MYTRDKISLILGFGLGLLGITATILGSIAAGIVALLLLSLFILTLLALQRKQLAKVQQRTLMLLRADKSLKEVSGEKKQPVDGHQAIAVSTKKVIGLLQAQQMSMELLNDKIERLAQNQNDQ